MRISDWSSDVCSSDLGFAGKSSLSTWLTRILINEALGRVRANKRRRSRLEDSSVPILDDYREKLMRGSTPPTSPEAAVACGQIRQILEDAIARLPAPFRTVFVLRSEEHTSELQSLMRISYAVFCLKKKKNKQITTQINQ